MFWDIFCAVKFPFWLTLWFRFHFSTSHRSGFKDTPAVWFHTLKLVLRNKTKINCRFFFLSHCNVTWLWNRSKYLDLLFVFFRSFLCLTCNHTVIPAIKLEHIILKYIYKFFHIIILYACDTEVFCLHK